jgi:hypothetical protein
LVEQYDQFAGLLQDYKVYDITNPASPSLETNQTSAYMGAKVNMATSSDDNWVFIAFRENIPQSG